MPASGGWNQQLGCQWRDGGGSLAGGATGLHIREPASAPFHRRDRFVTSHSYLASAGSSCRHPPAHLGATSLPCNR